MNSTMFRRNLEQKNFILVNKVSYSYSHNFFSSNWEYWNRKNAKEIVLPDWEEILKRNEIWILLWSSHKKLVDLGLKLQVWRRSFNYEPVEKWSLTSYIHRRIWRFRSWGLRFLKHDIHYKKVFRQ